MMKKSILLLGALILFIISCIYLGYASISDIEGFIVTNASSTAANASSTVANASSTVANASSTAANASSTVANASSTVANASSTAANASSTVANSSSTVANASSTAANASSTVANSSSTVANASSTVANNTKDGSGSGSGSNKKESDSKNPTTTKSWDYRTDSNMPNMMNNGYKIPQTNLVQSHFNGTNNVYSPYLYVKEQFQPITYDMDNYQRVPDTKMNI